MVKQRNRDINAESFPTTRLLRYWNFIPEKLFHPFDHILVGRQAKRLEIFTRHRVDFQPLSFWLRRVARDL